MAFDPNQYIAEKSAPAPSGGFDPDAYLKEKEGPSLITRVGQAAADAAHYVGEKYERYVTGPTRAALMEEAKNGLAGKPLTAFASQFGNDPWTAPTGQDIAAQLGASTTPQPSYGGKSGRTPVDASNAQITGSLIDIGADPLIVAPVGDIVKGGAKLFGKTAGMVMDAAGKVTQGVAAGADAVTGTQLATKAVGWVGRMIDSTGSVAEAANQALKKVFTPKIASDFNEMSQIAVKNGIDPTLLPESIEFGKGSFLDSASRARREGPLGEEYLQKFEDGKRAVQSALDNKVDQIGGGAPLSTPAAGVSLRQSFDGAVRDFWNSIEMKHDDIYTKWAPGLHIDGDEMGKLNSVVNGVEKFAKGTKLRTLEKSQAQELLNAVDAIRSGNGSYKQMVETMRSIGNAAFETAPPNGVIPSDIEKFRKLYFAMDDALINTVEKHVSPDFAAELKMNNQAMSQMFEKKNQIGYILSDKNIAPEDAFKRVILNGDTDQLATVVKMLPPEDVQKLKGAFIESLVKRDPDGSFNMSSLYNAMRNKQNQIKMLFNPDEIQEIGELLQLGDKFGKAVLSSSGTGASGVFHHISSSLKSSVANDTLIEGLKSKARKPVTQGIVDQSGRSPLFYPSKGAQLLAAPGGARNPSSNDNAMQRRMNNSK